MIYQSSTCLLQFRDPEIDCNSRFEEVKINCRHIEGEQRRDRLANRYRDNDEVAEEWGDLLSLLHSSNDTTCCCSIGFINYADIQESEDVLY